jgi:hypothetical protein
MKYFRFTCFFLIILLAETSVAQLTGNGPTNISSYPDPKDPSNNRQITVIDGVYVKTDVPQKKMVPYEFVRESDVMWSKRVWSYIDLREKINHPLYYPHDFYAEPIMVTNAHRNSLWNIITYHIKTADFTPFLVRNSDIEIFTGEAPESIMDGYDLRYPKYPKPGKNYSTDSEYRSYLDSWLLGTGVTKTLPRLDEDGLELQKDTVVNGQTFQTTVTYDTTIKTVYLTQHIVRYHLKTDWFFDKERSLLDHRIIAIAPVVYVEATADSSKNSAPGGGDGGAFPAAEEEPKVDEFGQPIVDKEKNKKLVEAEKTAKTAFEASKSGKDTLAMLKLELAWKESEKTAAEATAIKRKPAEIESIQKRIDELTNLIADKEKKPEPPAGGGGKGPKNYVYKELFWLYFPQMRPYLQNYYTYNDKNDAQWMSFDDLFWKTRYSQVIYKETTNYDRKIESVRKGVDALMESERIKEEIRTFEHDVWNF